MNLKHSIAAVAMSALIGGSAVGVATVAFAAPDAPGKERCAQQQAQVDRAVAKLEDLQAVLAKTKKDEARAEKALERAAGKAQREAAEAKVAAARADRSEAAKAKKAQVQRLAQAQARLAECEDKGTPTPSPTETSTPSSTPTVAPLR